MRDYHFPPPQPYAESYIWCLWWMRKRPLLICNLSALTGPLYNVQARWGPRVSSGRSLEGGEGCTSVERNWEMRWVISERHGEQSVHQYPHSYWTDSATLHGKSRRRKGGEEGSDYGGDIFQYPKTPAKIILSSYCESDNNSHLFRCCCLPVLSLTTHAAYWLYCSPRNIHHPPTHTPEAPNRKRWLAKCSELLP